MQVWGRIPMPGGGRATTADAQGAEPFPNNEAAMKALVII